MSGAPLDRRSARSERRADPPDDNLIVMGQRGGDRHKCQGGEKRQIRRLISGKGCCREGADFLPMMRGRLMRAGVTQCNGQCLGALGRADDDPQLTLGRRREVRHEPSRNQRPQGKAADEQVHRPKAERPLPACLMGVHHDVLKAPDAS